MASQYAADQLDFYNDCKEDGGAIKILRPKSQQIDNAEASSDIVDSSFWEGTDVDPDVTETFGIFIPGSSSINPFDQVYIPAYGLDYEVTRGMLIQDARDQVYQITQLQSLKPDGSLVIFYTANLEYKPDYTFNV